MSDRCLFTRWASAALLACLFTTGLPKPITAQMPNAQPNSPNNSDLQTADRELETLSRQPFELPLFTQKSKLQTIYQRYAKYNHKPGLALTRLELAWIAYQDADYAEADRQLRPIENSFSNTMSAYWRSKSLKGLLQLEAGKPREALQNLLLSQANFHSWPQQQAKQIGLANAYRNLGQYRKSAGYATSASRLGASQRLRTEALQILGDTAFEVGQFEEAIGHYEIALGYTKSLGNTYGRRNLFTKIHLLTQLGRAYQALGKTAEAQRATNSSVQLAQQLTSPQQAIVLILALNASAMVNLDAGNQTIALQQLQQAQAISETRTQNLTGNITTLLNLGHYYQKIGDFDQAAPYYEKVRELADRIGDKASEARANSALGQLQLKQNKPKSAIQSLSRSIDLFEALRPELKDAQRLTLAETQTQTYQLLQTALIQDNNPDQALITTERARARALVDLLSQRSQTPKNVGEASPKGNREILPTVSLDSIKATAKAQNATIVTYAITRQLDRPDLESELHTWVVQPNGSIHFRTTDLKRPPNELAIDQASVQTAAQTTQNRRSGAATLKQLITRSGKTRSSLTESDRPENYARYSEASRAAHQLLIEPIEALLPKNDRDPIIFVPQGELFLIPFQSLQDKQGQYLIQKHTLQIAPSIQTLNFLTPSKKSNPNPLIVGNPSPMPTDYDALPGSELEATAIAKLFNTTAILGVNATKDNILAKMPSASLIHLATHGTMDDRSGSESAIILANTATPTDKNPLNELNSTLTAGEILDLRLNANLVVLSACNTGRGQITGEGVIGLTRSFLSAGVPSLVVSLWQVPDKPTSTLMIAFHENLKKGENKAQALRQAMLTTMQQYPEPTDWAGFMLVGRSD
jgi:CHAT domain-containing protein